MSFRICHTIPRVLVLTTLHDVHTDGRQAVQMHDVQDVFTSATRTARQSGGPRGCPRVRFESHKHELGQHV